ncbi:hypothetical protein SAY86_006230 [Trapa natans]|uniref:Uncharacterized protein n=1 Tax=Trapa natans TaxID=22666 RepID=A0AAN7LDJ8_TRANT|nr:hypothetical protein SAY86_006230 [Trapa natans]
MSNPHASWKSPVLEALPFLVGLLIATHVLALVKSEVATFLTVHIVPTNSGINVWILFYTFSGLLDISSGYREAVTKAAEEQDSLKLYAVDMKGASLYLLPLPPFLEK